MADSNVLDDSGRPGPMTRSRSGGADQTRQNKTTRKNAMGSVIPNPPVGGAAGPFHIDSQSRVFGNSLVSIYYNNIHSLRFRLSILQIRIELAHKFESIKAFNIHD